MNEMVELAYRYLHLPYHWGGSNPMTGFDCSGFIVDVLKAFGRIPARSDFSSQELYTKFRGTYVPLGRAAATLEKDTPVPPQGALLFFGKNISNGVVHVAMSVGNWQMIEAGGGDSSTTTLERAKEQGACIRVRPILNRADYLGYAMVF